MMRKPSTKPAGSVSSTTPGLQLPIDYLSSVLGVTESNLLNLDQSLCESLFSNLFSKLQLPHVADLVHVRVEERLDSKMAGKIGSSGVSASAQAQAKKAEEDSYRAVFTKLILKQALALGFKGIVNPATVSLSADKKLALRLLDFLAKKCYGPPLSSADKERERVTPLKVKPTPHPREEQHASPVPSPTAAASSARRAPAAPAPAAVSRPPKPSSAHASHSNNYHPSPKPNPGAARAVAPPPPVQKHIASPGEQSYGSDEFDAEAGEEYHQEEEQQDEFENDDETEFNDDAEDEPQNVPLAKPIYDGKFADRDFDSSVSSARSSSVASRAVRRQPAAAPVRSHSRSSAAQSGSSKHPAAVVSPLAGANEENWSREDFKSELHAERQRHHETNAELQRMTQLYEQLLGEHRVEKFSARRVMLLKAQNMQLERQLGMMQQQTDATRSCMNELSTVVVGLENSVAEAAANSASDDSSAPPPGLRKAANRLHGLESAISSTKHRLAKYIRGELQFSQEETKYLQPDAPLLPNSMYSGTLTHLNLDRVHALESSLAALHEQLLTAHQMLQSLALIPPFQQAVREFLSRAPQMSNKTAVTRMENLLDAIRTSAFELQSLGIALPSHTAFTAQGQDAFLAPPTPSSSESSEDGHESRWIWHVQQALKKRGVPSSIIDQILTRASQDHTATQLRFRIYEEQLKHYRELNSKMMIAVMELFHSTQQLISKFYVQNNALFAEASRELNQCVGDWHRNSEGINVQRLLTTLQSIFPSVKQLLYNPTAAPSTATIGLPDIAANLQVDVEACVREFQQRLTQLQEQAHMNESQHDHDHHSQPEQSYHEPRARRVVHHSQAAPSNPRARPPQHQQELPPFQF